MTNALPQVKNKKLINLESFKKLAQKVKKSFEEEISYVKEKGEKNGSDHSSRIYSFS